MRTVVSDTSCMIDLRKANAPLQVLYDALRVFHDDDLVFLPADELLRRIGRLAQLRQKA